MDRRDFLTAASGLVIGMAAPNILLAQGKPIYSGWVPDKRETINFKTRVHRPYFAQVAQDLAGTGRGKKALLWKFFEKVTKGSLVPHWQSVGDCVAQGWGLGIDILDAIQIAHGRGSWTAKCATELLYAGGRVEIGKGKIHGDGMHGSWLGQWVNEYGVLLRRPYLDGKYDFTKYSGKKARKWAHVCKTCTTWGGGVPDELEPLAKKHPVKTVTLVTSWEQARDAIYNGYPVAVCSSQGFGDHQSKRERESNGTLRDKDGFLAPDGKWYHCMLLAGMDDTIKRPGGLFINSWGPKWLSGPGRFGQPKGSFWADSHVINDMLAQEDSFAMSNYVGYPKRNLDYHLY